MNIKPVIILGPFCNLMFNADYHRKTDLINTFGDIVNAKTVTEYEFSGNAAMAVDF